MNYYQVIKCTIQYGIYSNKQKCDFLLKDSWLESQAEISKSNIK